jgi:hypothetical protein
MPYTTVWEPNDLFLEHGGIRIFHTYKNDEEEVLTYWYGTSSESMDCDDETTFDIRELPTWGPVDELNTLYEEYCSKKRRLTYDKTEPIVNAIRMAVIAAIDTGCLQGCIDSAEDRPKALPYLPEECNCHAEIEFDGTNWKLTLRSAFGVDTVSITITKEQKEQLASAGFANTVF